MRRLLSTLGLVLALAAPAFAQSISRVTPLTAGPSNLTATDPGTCAVTNTGCVVLAVGGYTALSAQLTGTYAGLTLAFESSIDGTTWVATSLVAPGNATPVTQTSGNGLWNGSASTSYFRARVTAIGSGTAVVSLRATLGLMAPSIAVYTGAGISGPGTSVDNDAVSFDGVTGAVVKDSGVLLTPSVVSGLTGDVSSPSSVTLANAGALRTDTTNAHTARIQGYDTDTGPGYVTFATVTNGTAPSLAFANPAGGGTITYNKVTVTQPASGATLTIADGKTLNTAANLTVTPANNLTLTTTGATNVTFPTSGTIARTNTNADVYGGTTVTAIASGFGTLPTIETGSVDFGGRVTVGVGGDTAGVVTLAGTYTVAPHCTANNETTAQLLRVSASTTTLTFAGTLTAADTITWACR